MFVQLSQYSGNKTISIKSEIQECLKEFKRTHQVGWDVGMFLWYEFLIKFFEIQKSYLNTL